MDLRGSRISTNIEDASPRTFSSPQEYDDLRRYHEGKELTYGNDYTDWMIRTLLMPGELQKLQNLSRNQLARFSGPPTSSPIDSILEQLLSEESSWPPMMDPTKQSSWTPD